MNVLFAFCSALRLMTLSRTFAETDVLGCANSGTACLGYRQPDDLGCCPLLPGDRCPSDDGAKCDEKFGYTCVQGLCKGPFDLTISEVGDSFITLTWSSTKSRDCSVLYATEYNTDYSSWNSHEVGDVSSATLRQLTADTVYYLLVTSYDVNRKDDVFSEVVIFQTSAKQSCLYDGKLVPVGEKIVIDCEEYCVCATTGYFRCARVCSKDDVSASSICNDETQEECCHLLNYCLYENCTYIEEHVPHAYSWTIDCTENCTCFDGEVTCVSLCPELAEPSNCSNLLAKKSLDGCCDIHECNDTDERCVYDGISYKADSWFSADDCQLCHCNTGSDATNCVGFDRCLSTLLPQRSRVCSQPIVAENHCCQQVVCEEQTDPRYLYRKFTVTRHDSSSMLVRFQFLSSNDENNANSVTLFYTSNSSDENFQTWFNSTLDFNTLSDVKAVSSQIEKQQLYKINNNYFFIVDGLDTGVFYYIRTQITFRDVAGVTTPHPFLTPPWAFIFPGTAPSILPFSAGPRAVFFDFGNMTSTSVSLNWSVTERLQLKISSYLLRYKALSDQDWMFTKRLIFSTMKYKLQCLYPARWYKVELVAYPLNRVLGTQFFNTTPIKESSDTRFLLKLSALTINADSVTLQWSPLKQAVITEAEGLSVYWSYHDDEENLQKVCRPVSTYTYTLDGLYPNTMYSVWLGVNLKSGATVFSRRVYFVTSKEEHHSTTKHSLTVAIAITCISLVGMAISIAIAVFLFRCKDQVTYKKDTAFENKIFQIYNGKDDAEL